MAVTLADRSQQYNVTYVIITEKLCHMTRYVLKLMSCGGTHMCLLKILRETPTFANLRTKSRHFEFVPYHSLMRRTSGSVKQ